MPNERSFANPGAKVAELEQAWQDRLGDADHLLKAGRYSTSVAMGLYALEIVLKIRICKTLDLDSLPRPFEIHDLRGLLILSGLSRAITSIEAQPIRANWDELQAAANDLDDLRYKPGSVKSIEDAQKLFTELSDSSIGVIPWILSQP